MARRSPPRLSVVNPVSAETVRRLEVLLEQARAGNMVGMAFCVLTRGGGYSVHLVGTAKRNLAATRGMVCSLDDEISQMISDRADEAPDLEGFD